MQPEKSPEEPGEKEHEQPNEKEAVSSPSAVATASATPAPGPKVQAQPTPASAAPASPVYIGSAKRLAVRDGLFSRPHRLLLLGIVVPMFFF